MMLENERPDAKASGFFVSDGAAYRPSAAEELLITHTDAERGWGDTLVRGIAAA
jgi:hypothetical protein